MILEELRELLMSSADKKTKEMSGRFFKPDAQAKTYGIKTPWVNAIAKDFFKQIKHLEKIEIYNLCEELWKSQYLEEAIVACHWSYALRKQFEPQDFVVFEKWVKQYVNNWADCDTFCNHTMGTFVSMFPEYIESIVEWTESEKTMVRRAAAVTFIIPAKEGRFTETIFKIADKLLLDQEDLVQKGYGWMLKSASKPYANEVFSYVLERKNVMPRTALRYAIEKLPDSLRKEAMAK